MSTIPVNYVIDKQTGNPFFPITHINAVRDDNGNPLSGLLDAKAIGSGVCSTAASTIAKEVTVSDHIFSTGSILAIKFVNGISIPSATLAVTYTDADGDTQTTSAIPIYHRGVALAANLVAENDTIMMRYNGTQLDILGEVGVDSPQAAYLESDNQSVGAPDFDAFTDAVHVLEQTLTNEEKAQARTNINAQEVISDLSDIRGAAIANPVDISTLSPSSTFNKWDTVTINGIIYRATTDTSNFPVKLVLDDNNNFATQTLHGVTVFVIADDSVNSDWEVFQDTNNNYKLEQTASSIIRVGTCLTAGSTAAKALNINGFVLRQGCMVSILFVNGFTVSNPTLNISSTGAKAIKLYGNNIPMGKVRNNTVLTMVYDLGVWNVTSIESMQVPSGDAVDLGLPSGLLWCSHNVGAESPEDTGLYFSWGNVEGHAEGSGYNFDQTTYNSTSGGALTGNIAVGDTYDAARANMGGPWRLPSNDEYTELRNNCTALRVTQNGVSGIRLTSNKNGNAIFLPLTGNYDGTTLNNKTYSAFYWASTLYSSTEGRGITFNTTYDVILVSHLVRYQGVGIRAVQ